MLRYSEHALHQIKGCPQKCPLVDGKPCNPNAIYTRVPFHLRDRPEVGGHAHLCDPCLKLVQAQYDREQLEQLTDRRSERDKRKQLKVASRREAQVAEDELRAAYEAARMARVNADKAVAAYQASLDLVEREMLDAVQAVQHRTQEMRLARHSLERAKRKLEETTAQKEGLPRPLGPAEAEYEAMRALMEALETADRAWDNATASTRRKHLDKALHKRADKLLRAQLQDKEKP